MAEDGNKKNFKIKLVKSVEISGKVSKKLGCFDESKLAWSFVFEQLEKVPNSEYVKFKERYAESRKDLDDFTEKINSCDEL